MPGPVQDDHKTRLPQGYITAKNPTLAEDSNLSVHSSDDPNREDSTSEALRPFAELAQSENASRVTSAENPPSIRKRTKTGCLSRLISNCSCLVFRHLYSIACRKRRIKCGEERPTCANCIRSKRSCEGYTPRLQFKDPLGSKRIEETIGFRKERTDSMPQTPFVVLSPSMSFF